MFFRCISRVQPHVHRSYILEIPLSEGMAIWEPHKQRGAAWSFDIKKRDDRTDWYNSTATKCRCSAAVVLLSKRSDDSNTRLHIQRIVTYIICGWFRSRDHVNSYRLNLWPLVRKTQPLVSLKLTMTIVPSFYHQYFVVSSRRQTTKCAPFSLLS